MNQLDDRRTTLAAGVVMLVLGLGVTAVLHDSAVSAVIVLAACTLVLYAFMWDRLADFGPSGIKLFERIREETAQALERKQRQPQVIEREALDQISIGDMSAVTGSFSAAALIRAAKSPEELAEALVKVVERPETAAERRERVRKDDQERAKQEHYSGRTRK